MKKITDHFSRRRFIQQASLASFGLTTAGASLFKLNSVKAAAKSNLINFDVDDYKAIVCLFQTGGNDSHNMLIPLGNTEYAEYARTRTNLAIRRQDILTLNGSDVGGKSFGVHPSMSGVQELYNQRKLTFVNNLGTMIYPVSKSDYENDNVPLPLGLFSHSDQIAQWQTAQPNRRAHNGWGGRLADMFKSVNDASDISINITLSGTNLFQFGDSVVEFSVGPSNDGYGIKGYQRDRHFDRERTQLIDGLLHHNYDDIYRQSYVDVVKNSIESQRKFQESLSAVGSFQTEFSNSSLSRSFETIARIVAARDLLGFKRQIFFVRFGGWDHHDNLLGRQEDMLGVLSRALHEFSLALDEINAFDKVLTFTMSEFGRTLTSNGNGSDHAWGGNVMTMGGMVNGGRMFGQYPSLELGNPLEIGRGRLIPTMSNDEYFSEIALWFGASYSDLSTLFPNLTNFYSPTAGNMPVGFLTK